MPLFRRHTTFYEPSEAARANVAQYTNRPRLSGYISAEQQERAAVVAQRQGDGRVVLFLDNPDLRGLWYAPKGLLLNAVFFSSLF